MSVSFCPIRQQHKSLPSALRIRPFEMTSLSFSCAARTQLQFRRLSARNTLSFVLHRIGSPNSELLASHRGSTASHPANEIFSQSSGISATRTPKIATARRAKRNLVCQDIHIGGNSSIHVGGTKRKHQMRFQLMRKFICEKLSAMPHTIPIWAAIRRDFRSRFGSVAKPFLN
jgi:hypothetical protein